MQFRFTAEVTSQATLIARYLNQLCVSVTGSPNCQKLLNMENLTRNRSALELRAFFSLTLHPLMIRGVHFSTLFHPSGTHVNGHLDAVFVFLGLLLHPRVRGCRIKSTQKLKQNLILNQITLESFPNPTPEKDVRWL